MQQGQRRIPVQYAKRVVGRKMCIRDRLKAIEEMNAANEKKVIKTWSRPSTIFPQMVGHTCLLYTSRCV